MTTISAALEEFLLACGADGLSPATTKWYSIFDEDELADFHDRFTPMGDA